MVRDLREQETDDSSPIHTEEMSVYDNGGSFVVGVTSFGRKLHQLAAGERVTVEIYADGIFIATGGEVADE